MEPIIINNDAQPQASLLDNNSEDEDPDRDFNKVIPIPITGNKHIPFNINNDFRDMDSVVRRAQPQQPLEPIIINCVNDIIYDNP